MFKALEKVVTDPRILPFLRVYAWWMLMQNWGTLRFSDHRGISPSTVSITVSALSAVLSRSKTIGADKSVGSRPLTTASCCYLAEPTWIQAGFTPARARTIPSRLPTPIPSVKPDLRDHGGDEVRIGVRAAEPSAPAPSVRRRATAHSWHDPVLDTAFRTSFPPVSHSSSGVRKIGPGLPGRVERPGKRQVRKSIAH